MTITPDQARELLDGATLDTTEMGGDLVGWRY